jgi:hypothetical protein
MSDSTAGAIIILAIVIIVIGGPFAVNEYSKWREREEINRYYQTWTWPTPVPTTPITQRTTPVPTTPAAAVKNDIFGVWWCTTNSRQLSRNWDRADCYQFYGDKIVYHAGTIDVGDPTLSWWINSQGYYETSEPTFIYKGNTLEDTFGNVYQYCPYQDQSLCLGWIQK